MYIELEHSIPPPSIGQVELIQDTGNHRRKLNRLLRIIAPTSNIDFKVIKGW
jgi:hypothetical protein